MNSKVNQITSLYQEKNLDGLLVTSPANISYLTDYLSRDSWLLLSKKENYYLTDSRYTAEASKYLKADFQVKQINSSGKDYLKKLCQQLKLKNLGFEGKNLTYAQYHKLSEALGKTVNLIHTHNLVEDLRQIKTAQEIDKIRQATRITVNALNFIRDLIQPGRSEIEISGELERFIRYNGGTGSAFDIIVASGPNSSYPHHITSSRKIGKNEIVLIDIGAEFQGYKSDLTRVFFSGRIPVLAQRIYTIVLKAQKEAIGRIKPGVSTAEIDRVARQVIAKNGFARAFAHNLGHGVGLEVHEAPGISGKASIILKKNMVFTIEPGIYLPGKFGVRIEDVVLVTQKGVEILSGPLHK